jgi:hypothetical protein
MKIDPNELSGMLRKDLARLASDLDIRGRTRMKKAELIEAISKEIRRGATPTASTKSTAKKTARKKSNAATIERETGKLTGRTIKADSHHEPVGSSSVQPPRPAVEPEAYVDRGAELPRHYGRDLIVGMVRDPNWAYVYWELEGGKRERLTDEYGPAIFDHAQWVLRLHNLSAGAVEDMPVLLETGNWYLNVPDASDFFVEIGLVTRDKTFISLATSNRFSTPRADVSPATDEEWMIVEEDFQKLVEMTGGHFERLVGSRPTSGARLGMRRISGMHSVSMGSHRLAKNGRKK